LFTWLLCRDHLVVRDLDGIVMKRSLAGEVRNASLLVASAVNSEGFREILGICEGAKEDKSGWSAFLRHQSTAASLKGVQLVISDACRGLVESVADFLPEALPTCASQASMTVCREALRQQRRPCWFAFQFQGSRSATLLAG
jgi:transposase-like protein